MTSRQAGFTLLEILIAMTLLGVMMVLIFGTLRVSVRSWESGEKQAAQVSQLLVLHNFLRSHLTRMKPWEDDFSEDGPVFSFQGAVESVQFVSTLPLHNRGSGGWHKFNIQLTKNRDQTDLIVKLEPFFPALDEAHQPIDDVVLIENVEAIRFSYFGSDEPDEEAQWFDEWQEKSYFPKMIRIDVKVRGEKIWPPLVVAPKIAGAGDSSS
jgi:general secretion pathway protein J